MTAVIQTAEPDFKALFKEALYQLRCVSGSRNSFTSEARAALADVRFPRTPEVENMHRRAYDFLKKHQEYDID